MMHVMRRSGFLFLGGMMLLAAALALGAAWFARPEAALAANGNEPSAWAKDVVHKAYIEGARALALERLPETHYEGENEPCDRAAL